MLSKEYNHISDLLFDVSANKMGWDACLSGMVNIVGIQQIDLHIFGNDTGVLDARYSFSSDADALRPAPNTDPPSPKPPSPEPSYQARPPCQMATPRVNGDRSQLRVVTPAPSSCLQMCNGFSLTGQLINDHQYLMCLKGGLSELDPNVLNLPDDVVACMEKALNHWLEDQYRRDLIQRLFETCEKSNYGICYMEQDGKILYQNAAMRNLSEQQDGIRIIRGEFCFDDQEISKNFKTLCKQAATFDGTFDPFIKIERPSGSESYLLELYKVQSDQSIGFEHSLLVLTVKDLDAKATISTAPLIRLFGLTHTESIIAHQLFLNKSEQEIAKDMNNSLNTIKTHRKRIYSKLNVRNRGEFVALVVLILM